MREKIESLYQLIADQITCTPLVKNPALSRMYGCELFLKMENEQVTGSFKLRGAVSKLLSLKQEMGEIKEVVAASTGNHAAAVCHAALRYHCRPTIFVPETVSPFKLAKLEKTNALIKIAGKQSGESEILAAKWSEKHGIPMIHPYNDPQVIAGQGTIGLELIQQQADLEVVFVPVGGGGLISGIALYMKSVNPDITIVGVQPENASEMADSLKAGEVVAPSTKTTISDGTAGGLDPQTITLKYCRELVDEFILVSEKEIINALKLLDDHAGIQVEPAAALALAGLLQRRQNFKDKKCAVIVCGGNIQQEDFEKLLGKP